MSKVLYANSGSESNDTAVKVAWYYQNALGRPDKKKIISRLRGYHGVTITSGSLTGMDYAHKGFDLPRPHVIHAEAPHARARLALRNFQEFQKLKNARLV